VSSYFYLFTFPETRHLKPANNTPLLQHSRTPELLKSGVANYLGPGPADQVFTAKKQETALTGLSPVFCILPTHMKLRAETIFH
jgi:hypothetical protein